MDPALRRFLAWTPILAVLLLATDAGPLVIVLVSVSLSAYAVWVLDERRPWR